MNQGKTTDTNTCNIDLCKKLEKLSPEKIALINKVIDDLQTGNYAAVSETLRNFGLDPEAFNLPC